MYYSAQDHVFVICAYKENPFLPECIESLLSQKVKSNIIVVTSTPNDHINELCQKNNLPLHINTGEKGMAHDRNFAFEICKTKKLITLAHQDDIYEPDYLELILKQINKSKKPLIAYTDYYEIRGDNKLTSNRILKIKRIMNFMFKFRFVQSSKRFRRIILAFGDPICCPSVTFALENLDIPLFDTSFKNGCDYKTWADISKLKGEFIYIPELLLGHRIYPDSATTENIGDKSRSNEDFIVISSFWPGWIAKILSRFYRKAERVS